MYKTELSLNNLQWLICHKTKPNHLWLSEGVKIRIYTKINIIRKLQNTYILNCNVSNCYFNKIQILKIH